jgi:hypothetical protein
LLLKAIKEVFEERIEKSKPRIDESNNNEALGEKYRAYIIAQNILERAYMDIIACQTEEKKDKKFQKER